MKKTIVLTAALLLATVSCAFAANIVLTSPQRSGGPGVLDAIANRSSAAQSDFKPQELSTEELSTLLWAATGRNREPKGWTVPMAMGREPYVSVYVMMKSGSYLYNWEKNALMQISSEKNCSRRAVSQDFAKSAPCILVFVSSGTMNMDNFNYIATGAMSQNVYLAAEALGLKTRFLASFNKVNIEEALNLGPVMKVTGVMAVGRQ
ncbi:MAG: nitroreductase family protein [Synergistaceae bacterium]|nr:nitroreductase family protein [Synergistaceae bacterium]